MKIHTLALNSALLLGLLAQTALAQPADRPERGPGRGPGADRQFGPPPHPLMTALDANRDGELSKAELENAVVALKKLDRNKNGKLDRNELRPMGRGFGAGAQGGPGARPGAGINFAERIMRFDENKDGKVTEDELPERMQRVLERADTNQDGAIDKGEAEKMAERFGARNRGDRPRQGQGQGRGQGRPDRPDRPE